MVRVAHCCFIVVIIVFHVIIFYVWLDVMTRGGGWFRLLLSSLSPISILSFLAYCYRFYFISADHDELRFGYALWSVKLNVTDIAQIEETNIRWIEWRGQGWRLKPLKHIGYITGNGSGIHLVLTRIVNILLTATIQWPALQPLMRQRR